MITSPARYWKIVQHYENCLARFGDTPRGVDWPRADDARTRYRVMLEVRNPLPRKPSSLLDFGCGTAGLYDYMRKHHVTGLRYAGLDMSPAFIQVCQKKYPRVPFYCQDVLKSRRSVPAHDFVIMNGVFTEKRSLGFEEMFRYFGRTLEHMFSKTGCAMAFNVMSKHVDWERPDLFHVPFDRMASFLTRHLTRNFVFRNDYGLYEYTVYVYK